MNRRGRGKRVAGALAGFLWGVFLIFMPIDEAMGMDGPGLPALIRSVRFGVAAHDIDGLWSGRSKESGPDICVEATFNYRLFSLLAADAFPNLGLSLNTRGDTSKVYAGFLMQWKLRSQWFVATGFGLALHDGKRHAGTQDRKSLGAKVLFRTPIEIGWIIDSHHRLVVAFDHISNAHLANPNEGLDTLGLFYSYRF
ncbi:acyloxyacyl hydrolase [Desulfosarcina ovata]|uniref:Acyloxyacyl hydrolase n=1 Tax=Desulfosarcina ovata subsp. ovata TaxID=2752305 RepID=A0A5K8ACA5_9BACT|nr:acyloxyacyl hydrolase [Desulfosarcina ovata]BBO90129.1 hypothetical protein DSCOOX_33090 [Desulfosarcina ovata subsp. ovata]